MLPACAVDDVSVCRLVLCKMLSKHFHELQVAEAANGAEVCALSAVTCMRLCSPAEPQCLDTYARHKDRVVLILMDR